MGDIMTQYGVNLSLAGLSMTIQLAATGICMFIGSMIQDRLGIRKSVILSIWAMVLGNAMASLSPSIWVFLVARTISGFGQGLYTVSMTPCISTWFADKERTYMLTFNTAANSIFLAVSYSIGRPLCNAFGSWQAVFRFYTAIIALIALLWTFLARDSAEALAAAQQRAKMTTGGKQQSSLRRAAKEIQYWKLLLFAGTFAIANTSIASFLPTYLTLERGMDATVATSISSLNSLFGIAGSLLGGVLCAQMWRRKPILIGAIALYILVGFGITMTSSGTWIIVLALAAGTLYFIPIAAQSTIMIETKQPFDPSILGGAASISSGIGQLLCVIVSFLFQGVAAASSMTVAYRVFFSLCLIGLLGALLLRETGIKPEKAVN